MPLHLATPNKYPLTAKTLTFLRALGVLYFLINQGFIQFNPVAFEHKFTVVRAFSFLLLGYGSTNSLWEGDIF
jgi:hypothetical protein